MPVYPYTKSNKEHFYYAFEVKDRNGKRKTIKERGFTGSREAKAAERAAQVEWDKGKYIDPSKLNYGEYVTSWLESKQDISIETRETNQGHLKNHIIPEIGHIPFQKVGPNDISKMITTLQSKGLADGTIRKIFNLVQTSYRTAVVKELVIRSPFDLLDKGSRPKTSKPKVDYWTKEEVKQFFKVVENRQKILFVLAIYLGLRRGEATGLRWQDVDFENSQIRIRQTLKPRQRIKEGGKNTNATRSISISPFVLSELRRHKSLILKECLEVKRQWKDSETVVCQTNGEPVSLANFHKFWTRIVENTSSRYIKYHDLRHTCASLYLSAKIHPKVVQELLGHSSIKVTLDLYSHVMPNMQHEAVKVMDELLN